MTATRAITLCRAGLSNPRNGKEGGPQQSRLHLTTHQCRGAGGKLDAGEHSCWSLMQMMPVGEAGKGGVGESTGARRVDGCNPGHWASWLAAEEKAEV